jgi:large subunit ribosomal protein L17
MRHRKHQSKLNRTSEHRLAMMKNLAAALIDQERIHTTHVKAMQLRSYVEPLVTLARAGDQASQRLAFSRLGQKVAVKKLFTEIGPRVGERAGGYTRVVKDAPRAGDGALMAYIEFVDAKPKEAKPEQPKSVKQRLHERRKEMAKARR